MEEYDFLIDLMTWSFSRINSFHNCPREWKWHYLECNRSGDNAMAQFGTLCHSILERYAKGELEIFELSQVYEEEYPEVVTEPFPSNQFVDIADQYYQKGLDYFDNIDLDLENFEVLGVEKKVGLKIGNYDVVGFIDLLLRNKETGEITILDHKSASIKKLKSGKISKSDQEHFQAFKYQLYLYAKAVIEEYGRVDYLKWNLFKARDYIEIPFDEKEYKAAEEWALNTIHTIENEKEYYPNTDYFYCTNLCGLSKKEYCPYRTLDLIYSTNYSKCYSKRNKDYADFGEQGIEFCEEWKNSKREFFEWAMSNGFERGAKLCRQDPYGWFDQENCYFEIGEGGDTNGWR